METIVGAIVALIIAAVVIYIVGRLNLGLSVDGFGSAIIAALIIAIVGAIIVWLLGVLGITLGATGLLGAIVYLNCGRGHIIDQRPFPIRYGS
jgi:uncharacterized membrane protein YvlD (DUF360 family)